MTGFFKILKGNNSILQDEYVLFSFDNYQYWNLYGRFFLFVIVFYVSILNRTNRVKFRVLAIAMRDSSESLVDIKN